MIVCVCHAVPESAFTSAAKSGRSAAEVARATKAGSSCGCCAQAVAAIVEKLDRCQGGGACAACTRHGH